MFIQAFLFKYCTRIDYVDLDVTNNDFKYIHTLRDSRWKIHEKRYDNQHAQEFSN